MTDRIDTMRSYFVAAGHDVDPEFFAAGRLRQVKADVARMLGLGIAVPVALIAVLDLKQLGSPTDLAAQPVTAIVQGSCWLARCECGGAEFVDFERPIFMCCTCWNRAFGNRWRSVELPDPKLRVAIEAVLLARPVARTRSWDKDEPIDALLYQNADRQVAKGATDVQIAEAKAVK